MTAEQALYSFIRTQSTRKVSLIPCLQGAQAICGELTPEVLRQVADQLELPLSRVAAAATFYSAFNGMSDGEAEDRFLEPRKTDWLLEHPTGYRAARIFLRDNMDMIALLRAGKVRGKSGSGFPVADKWELTMKTPGEEKFIIANGSEGEGDTFKDYLLLVKKPELVLEGMLICGLYTGISTWILYIREEYKKAYSSVRKAIEEAYAQGVLGDNALGSGKAFHVEAVLGGGAYVSGEETGLLAMLEGDRSEPRMKPPYPGVEGLYGKPTIINNAESFAAAASLVLHGTEEFCRVGTGTAGGTKLYTVSGAVERPGVYELPHNVTARQVLELAGGTQVKGFQIGGGATGCFAREDRLDTVLDYDSLRAAGLSLGTAAIRFIGREESVPTLALRSIAFLKDQSCGLCTACRYGLAELTALLKQLVEGTGTAETLAEADRVCCYIGQTARCALGQAAPFAYRSARSAFPEEFEALL